MKKLVLASGNKNKIREMKELLNDLSLEILTAQDYPGLIMPEEDRLTFAGNAAKKAETVAAFSGEMTLADDSGLEVEALNGRPGIYSSRYAGREGDYEANNKLLLKELKGVPLEKRRARFVCAIAVAISGGKTHIVEEYCSGVIAESERGGDGFGYDPLFIYEPAGVTFAEMTAEEKNRVSHRGRALRRVHELLAGLLV